MTKTKKLRQCRTIELPLTLAEAVLLGDMVTERDKRCSIMFISNVEIQDVDRSGNPGCRIPANTLIYLDIKQGCETGFKWFSRNGIAGQVNVTEIMDV